MQMLNQINDIDIAEHFNLSGFACPCYKRVMLHPWLLEKLEKPRKIIEKPIHIVSVYRCPQYNHRIGGMVNSYHLIGLGADIKAKDINLIELLGHVEDVDFAGIGFYEKKNFLHLDVRPTKRARWR